MVDRFVGRWGAPIAAAAFVVGAAVRRDAAVGLVALGCIFVLLERQLPLHRLDPLRPGVATDAVHFLCDELLAAPLVAAVLVPGMALARVALAPARLPIAHRSDLMQWVGALVLAEVFGYWGHRWQHQSRWLWRFHKVHHSSPVLDWLAPNRRHPVDLAVSRLSVALPLLALGFPIPVLAAHFAVRRFQGLFVHANIRVDFGPLRWFIASPQFHHWHHTDDLELRDKNFAGEVPLLDWLFGTLHLPAGVWPDHYGIGEDAPSGYLAQLAWPFDRAVDRQPVKTDLVAVGSADDSS